MKTWETLTMGQKEAPRIGLPTALVARRVTGREVAAALAVAIWYSLRMTRRRGGAEGRR